MSSTRRVLDRLDVDQALVAKLDSRGVRTAEDALARSPLDVSELADVSHAIARAFIRDVARAVRPRATTASDALKRTRQALSTSVDALDDALGGGVAIGAITEIVGASGVGKTQLCLAACASACALGGVIYLDAERKFSAERFEAIAREKFGDRATTDDFLKRARVVTPSSLSDLIKRLDALEEAIIDHDVKLIVIDSVAHLARGEYAAADVTKRQSALGSCAATLKRHAEKHGCAVVCVNQVTTRIGREATHGWEDSGKASASAEDDASGITAALGTKWAHCVNTRVSMEVEGDARVIKIVKSPLAPLIGFKYHVDESGIVIDERMESATLRAREANVTATHRR